MEILKGKINPRLLLILQVTIIGTSTLFIVNRLLGASQSFPPPDPLRRLSIDEQVNLSEQCMDMMEDIKELLDQNNLEAIADYRCPLHYDPYIVTYEGDTIIVSDPHPELHGFEKMSVSNKNPDLILIN